jgi:hypothetical protein
VGVGGGQKCREKEAIHLLSFAAFEEGLIDAFFATYTAKNVHERYPFQAGIWLPDRKYF